MYILKIVFVAVSAFLMITGCSSPEPCGNGWDDSAALCQLTFYSSECNQETASFVDYDEKTADGKSLKNYNAWFGGNSRLIFSEYDQFGKQTRRGYRSATSTGFVEPPCYTGDECHEYEYDDKCRLIEESEGCENKEFCKYYRWLEDARMHLETVRGSCIGWDNTIKCITTSRTNDATPVDKRCNTNPGYCGHTLLDGCESADSCEAGGYVLTEHDQGCDGLLDECEFQSYYPGGEKKSWRRGNCIQPMTDCLLNVHEGLDWRQGIDTNCDGTIDRCVRLVEIEELANAQGRTVFSADHRHNCEKVDECYVTDYDKNEHVLFSGADKNCDKVPDTTCRVYAYNSEGRRVLEGLDSDCNRVADQECIRFEYDDLGRKVLKADDVNCDGTIDSSCNYLSYDDCLDDDELLDYISPHADGDDDMEGYECSYPE